MGIRLIFTLMISISAFPTPGRTDEAYTIKYRAPQPGVVADVDLVTTWEAVARQTTIDREPVDARLIEIPRLRSREIYRETILAVEGGLVVSRRRRYQLIEQDRNNHPTKHLIGKEIVINSPPGEQVSCHFENGPELLGDDAAWLLGKSAFSMQCPDDWWLPKAALKIGEVWHPNPKPYFADFISFIGENLETGSAACQLKRVYQRDQVLYGVVHRSITMPVRDEAPRIDSITYKLDGPIDGSLGPAQCEARAKTWKVVSVSMGEGETIDVDAECSIIITAKAQPVVVKLK